MSSAALLGSRFPPPSLFRQVLEHGWAMTVLAVGSEPPPGRGHSSSPLRVSPTSHIDGAQAQGHGVGRGEGTGLELSCGATGLLTVLLDKAGQNPPQAVSAWLGPVPPGAASSPAEGVLPGPAGGPPQDTLLSTLSLLQHLLGVKHPHGSQPWLCTLVPLGEMGTARRDGAQRLCPAQG